MDAPSLADLVSSYLPEKSIRPLPSDDKDDEQKKRDDQALKQALAYVASKQAPRASVGMPAQISAPPVATPAQIQSDAPVMADVSPQTPVAQGPAGAQTGATPTNPPQVPPRDAELAAAQAESARQRKLITLGGLLARNADIMRGADTSATDKLYAGMAEGADQPVKDLLARREQLRQLQAEQAQKSLSDPNSDVSKKAQVLMAGMGIPGAMGMSAADYQRMAPLIERGMSAQQAKASLDAENMRAANALAGENQRSAAAQANQIKLERERMAQERAMHLEDINAKNAGNKAGQPKPLGDQEMVKLKNYENALRSLDDLTNSYKNASGMGPSGGRYDDQRDQVAPTIAAADAPNARENPALIEETKHQLPDRFTRDSRGIPQLTNKRQQLLENYKTLVEGLRQGGYNTSGFDPGRFEQGGGDKSKTVVRKQVNRQLGKTRLTYADGTTEEVNGVQ